MRSASRASISTTAAARSLVEAIVWHGGEAKTARDRLIRLPKEEREALIAYLRSL